MDDADAGKSKFISTAYVMGMDRFAEYGLRGDQDELLRRAFRDAFQRAGLSRAQLGQAMEWYKERGQHLGGDVAKLTESFGEFAVEKGWASQHLEAAVSVYGQISEQGPAAVLAPAPSPEDDAATIKRADELLRTNPDAYWRDFELQEAVFEARAPGGRAGDGTGGGRLRHRAPHRPTRLRQVRRDAPRPTQAAPRRQAQPPSSPRICRLPRSAGVRRRARCPADPGGRFATARPGPGKAVSHGGARPGAGRPGGNGKKAAPRAISLFIVHEESNPNLCRVGLTKSNPVVLLSSMQTLNWRPLKLAAVLRVENPAQAAAIDRELTARLSSFSRGNGWFAVAPDRIVAEFHTAATACESPGLAPDYQRGTWGGRRPGSGRRRKTASPDMETPAPAE
jgi:hypothetical protein